jgi:hypothetical protein
MIYPLRCRLPDPHSARGPRRSGSSRACAEATASLTKWVSGWWSTGRAAAKPMVVGGYALAAARSAARRAGVELGQVLAIRFADRVGKGIHRRARRA